MNGEKRDMSWGTSDPAEPAAQGGSADVHLWDYVQVVLQRLPLAISVFIIVVALAALYSWTRTPRYMATARVLVQSTQVNITGIKDTLDPATAGVAQREFMQTQVQLFKSRPTLENVIAKTGLMSDPDFSGVADPVSALTKRIQVTPARNTFLIDVAVERADPRQAAAIVNSVVDSYLEDNRRRRDGISEEGLLELRKQADLLRAKLDSETKKIHEFMVKNDLVSFEKTQNIVLERLSDMSAKLTEIEPRRMALQACVEGANDAVAKGMAVDSIPEIIRSPVITELKKTLSGLQKDYAQLLERLGQNHPQLTATAKEIESVQNQLAMESTAILASLQIQFEQVQKEESLQREALEKHKQEVFHLGELASQYDVMNQTKTSVENAYQQIVKRIQEIDINQIGGQGENAFVISRAAVPTEKSWPRKGRNMVLAVIFGGALALGLCFFLDYMDTTLKTELDVRHVLGAKMLAGVPEAEFSEAKNEKPEMVSISQPRSHFAEAFRSLRTAIAFSSDGGRLRSMVITSTFPSEGKSLTSINLSIAEAQVNRRTLLVDADMRKPRLHKVLGTAPNGKGLANLLADPENTKFEDVAVKTAIENLWFLPCGPIPAKSVELLDSPQFDRLLKQMLDQFDFVVFDAPPSFELADALVIGKQTDGLIMVARSFSTQKYAAQDVVGRVRAAGVRLLGVVLNNVDQPRSGYYYGNYYYGRYGYYTRKYYYYGDDAGKKPKKQGFWAKLTGQKDEKRSRSHSGGGGAHSGKTV